MAKLEARAPGAGLMPVSDYLASDHDRLDALLASAVRLAAAGEWRPAAELFADFCRGLERHIRMEEEVLFPAFELRAGLAHGPTAVMRMEHRAIEERLRDLGELLAAAALGTPPAREELDRLAAALRDRLADHNVKEEEVLYPLTDQMHAEAEREELVQRMKATRP